MPTTTADFPLGHFSVPTLAAQLVALKVDLIVANNGTPAAQAALAATREIPIVVPAMSDPIANRLIANLARPGGNLTGLSNMASELYPKRLALLKEAMPGIARVALAPEWGKPLLIGSSAIIPSYRQVSWHSGRGC